MEGSEEPQPGQMTPTDQRNVSDYMTSCLVYKMGESSEVIPCFALLVWAAFAFPIKLSSSHPKSFPAFTLLVPSLILLVGE